MLISLDDGDTWFETDHLKVKTQVTEETESEIFTIVETGVRATAYLTDGSVYTEGEASWEQILKQVEV